jgi:hypothetical protein
MRADPRVPTGGVQKAAGHEIAVSGAPTVQRALWGFGRSEHGWGEQDWAVFTGCAVLEDSWTSGTGVAPLPGGRDQPGVRRSEARPVVAGR